MRVLVTGASGFIGANVVRALLSAGHDVRALVRSGVPESLAGLNLDFARGDLRDITSLEEALAGCKAVIHAAALYDIAGYPERAYWDTNVDGTRNLLTSARKRAVDRIVYTSSVVTIGPLPRRQPADETSFASPEDAPGPYHRSKIVAEQLVREAVIAGAPVVLLNPTAPIGPWDTRPTPLGRLVVNVCRGRMPAYVATGFNVVDVTAVAEAHVAALSLGEIGERYILGGENLPLSQLLGLVAAEAGRKPPRLRLPWLLAYAAAIVDEGLVCRVLGGPPHVPLAAVRLARHWAYYDSGKAQRVLGLRTPPAAEAVSRAVSWFREHRYID
jgi:dihydroflavonol-4-reductase